MSMNPEFEYEGVDCLSRFGVFYIVFGGGSLPLPILLWKSTTGFITLLAILLAFLLMLGLRDGISISANHIRVTRSCYGLKYSQYNGRVLENVWFDGDWGDSEGANGVVAQVDGQEFRLGSSRTMEQLYTALKSRCQASCVAPQA